MIREQVPHQRFSVGSEDINPTLGNAVPVIPQKSSFIIAENGDGLDGVKAAKRFPTSFFPITTP
jgi:hypothetical protein